MSGSDSWRGVSPERMALVAAVIVVLGSLGVASTLGASGGGTPHPSSAQGSAPPTGGVAAATAHPFASTANLALQIHERLAEDRHVLELELAASDFDISAVVGTVRRLNATARLGSDVAEALQRIAGSRAVGTALVDFYGAVTKAADNVLGKSVSDLPEYRTAAKRLLAALEPTAELQQRLEALIDSVRATPSVETAVATPSASIPATTTPTPTSAPATPAAPTATPTARPTTAPTPSGTVAPTDPPLIGQLQNPGFEAADPRPWALTLESPAFATMTVDSTAVPFEGGRSARIDIAVPSDARTGITLRQAGIEIAQSHRYTCSVAVRAAADREVRIRVASSSGETYGTRLVTVGPTWMVVEFEFGSFLGDPAAVIDIDLGRSAATTWIDAAQITDVSASVP
jgi:hypothetical protein